VAGALKRAILLHSPNLGHWRRFPICCHRATSWPRVQFRLCYRRDGQFSGAVVIEAASLFQVRLNAALAGLDPGFQCEGHELDAASRSQVPGAMVGRLLDAALR
jgi:hypothetical protein